MKDLMNVIVNTTSSRAAVAAPAEKISWLYYTLNKEGKMSLYGEYTEEEAKGFDKVKAQADELLLHLGEVIELAKAKQPSLKAQAAEAVLGKALEEFGRQGGAFGDYNECRHALAQVSRGYASKAKMAKNGFDRAVYRSVAEALLDRQLVRAALMRHITKNLVNGYEFLGGGRIRVAYTLPNNLK